MDPKQIVITKDILENIIKRWKEYLLLNSYKLFIEDNEFHDYRECLNLIKKAEGFQISAFAGKAQNKNTHPSRMPDLGEVNLLTRIAVIQTLTNKPIRIVLDGEYYADIFGEDLEEIKNYEKRLMELSDIVGLNCGYDQTSTFMTVEQFFDYANMTSEKYHELHDKYDKNSEELYHRIGIIPEDLIDTIRRILPNGKSKRLSEEEVLKLAKEFIIRKAILADAMEVGNKQDNYQRITILQYSKTNNPRINMEMNIAPWNSVVLFKNNFLNINTAVNIAYADSVEDERNHAIIDENSNFWGFTRNPRIFKQLEKS